MDFARSEFRYLFAYGSDVHPEQLALFRVRPEVAGAAVLDDHQMRFHGHSRRWDGGMETCVARPGQRVWGMVYRLTLGEAGRLDDGHDVRLDGTGLYFLSPVAVGLADGEVLPALMYKLNSLGPERPPSRPYLDYLREGARLRGLPAEALADLERRPTAEPRYQVPREHPLRGFGEATCAQCEVPLPLTETTAWGPPLAKERYGHP